MTAAFWDDLLARPEQYFSAGGLGELISIKGRCSQLPQYLAVMAGIRRTMDDWVPLERLQAFLTLLPRFGLLAQIESVFRPLGGAPVAGLSLTPTTHASGSPYPPPGGPRTGDSAHVIISTRDDWAAEAVACAWYPLCIGSRAIPKPWVDHRDFGLALGYPQCCVNFFMQYNDWPRFSTIAESARNSRHLLWTNNSLLKMTPFTLPFHMPCSFDCPATQRMGESLHHVMREYDTQYAEAVQYALTQCFLSINERVTFVLLNARTEHDGSVTFSRAISLYPFASVHEPRESHYCDTMQHADRLLLADGCVYLYRNKRSLGVLETRCDRNVAEVPVLLDFRHFVN